MASVNLSEFYYKTCEKLGKGVADIRYYQSRRSGINVVETDAELARTAGVEKCLHATVLSLADCYALALTRRLGATLLTTDGPLAKSKEIRTVFFDV